MKLSLLLCLSVCFLSLNNLFAQVPSQASWSVNPYEKKVFIENKGQFDGLNEKKDAKILYGVENLGTRIYFTSQGLTYRFVDFKKEENDPKKEKKLAALKAEKGKWKQQFKSTGDSAFYKRYRETEEKYEKLKGSFEVERILVDMEWVNSNPDVQLIVEDPVEEYFNYLNEEAPMEKSVYFAKAYKKLTYKNLYSNIDVEYLFHEKTGIKYNLILYPGADPSQIGMRYKGTESVFSDASGNIHLVTPKGDIIDHAPVTLYDGGDLIASSFKLNKNIVGFSLGNYRTSEKVIIDPWTIIPATLTPDLKAYEIGRDAAGNVYVYGGLLPFKVQKYSSTGVPGWTFSAYGDPQVGDLAVDPAGNCFITSGTGTSHFSKIDALGVLVWDRSGDYEPWRLTFNCDFSKLYRINGGGGNICTINTTTGVKAPMKAISDLEIRGITTDPNCSIYGVTAGTGAENKFISMKADMAVRYSVSSGHLFDYRGPFYTPGSWAGQNTLAAGTKNAYIFDGTVLDKRDKITGASLQTVVVPGGIMEGNAGVAIDSCHNIYTGSQTAIYKFDENLVQLGLPVNTTGAVYDMTIGTGGEILACGNGFVGSFPMLACAQYACNSLNLNLSSTPSTCSAKNGSATAAPTGSVGPYTYKWNTVPVQTTQTAVNLGAGIYTVTVTDAEGCTNKGTIKVNNSSGLLISLKDTVEIKCPGDMNGEITVEANGGAGPYTYTWSTTPVQTTATAVNLGAGTYTVTVKDVNNCTSVAAVTFTDPDALMPVIVERKHVSCQGNSDGYAHVSVTGGTLPYTYSWNTVPVQTTERATGLSAGVYTVTITDANGCTQQAGVTINDGPVLDVNVIPQHVSCFGGADGSAEAIAVTGGPYTYSWNTIPVQTTAIASGLGAGTYTVTLTDGNGCQATKSTVINEPVKLDGTITKTDITCFGSKNGRAVANPNGGSPSYTYTWNTGQTTAIINNLDAGTYTCVIKDSEGCEETVTTTIIEPPVLSAGIIKTDVSCYNGNDGVAEVRPTGGVYPYTYQWDGISLTDSILTGLPEGIYNVTISDAHGCEVKQQAVITQPSEVTMSLSLHDTSIAKGESLSIMAITGGGSGAFSYSWVPAIGTGAGPHIITPSESSVYTVSVQDNSTTQCPPLQDTLRVLVITDDFYFYVPNAFSPNGDGQNDKFNGTGTGIVTYKMSIFNRWGERVFETLSLGEAWDGSTAHEPGSKAPEGVYIYVIRLTNNKGKEFTYTGAFSLIE